MTDTAREARDLNARAVRGIKMLMGRQVIVQVDEQFFVRNDFFTPCGSVHGNQLFEALLANRRIDLMLFHEADASITKRWTMKSIL